MAEETWWGDAQVTLWQKKKILFEIISERKNKEKNKQEKKILTQLKKKESACRLQSRSTYLSISTNPNEKFELIFNYVVVGLYF